MYVYFYLPLIFWNTLSLWNVFYESLVRFLFSSFNTLLYPGHFFFSFHFLKQTNKQTNKQKTKSQWPFSGTRPPCKWVQPSPENVGVGRVQRTREKGREQQLPYNRKLDTWKEWSMNWTVIFPGGGILNERSVPWNKPDPKEQCAEHFDYTDSSFISIRLSWR